MSCANALAIAFVKQGSGGKAYYRRFYTVTVIIFAQISDAGSLPPGVVLPLCLSARLFNLLY